MILAYLRSSPPLGTVHIMRENGISGSNRRHQESGVGVGGGGGERGGLAGVSEASAAQRGAIRSLGGRFGARVCVWVGEGGE